MTARPNLEQRTGLYWMQGGPVVLDRNPPEGLSNEQRKAPYSVRVRNRWTDEARGNSASYQRPIINVLREDVTDRYTGLWEIVKVQAPAGYTPDDIKSFATLNRGIKSGDFKTFSTGKAINCPMVDDAVAVGLSGISAVKPRMEVWYRTNLGSCMMLDGWQTTGSGGVEDPSALRIFPLAESDDLRIQPFDLEILRVPRDGVLTDLIVAPVGEAFVGVRETRNADGDLKDERVYKVDDLPFALTTGKPRETNADPEGYRPIRVVKRLRLGGEIERLEVKKFLTDLDNLNPASLGGNEGPDGKHGFVRFRNRLLSGFKPVRAPGT